MSQHRRSAERAGRGAQFGRTGRQARLRASHASNCSRDVDPCASASVPGAIRRSGAGRLRDVLPADRLHRAVRGRRRVAVVTGGVGGSERSSESARVRSITLPFCARGARRPAVEGAAAQTAAAARCARRGRSDAGGAVRHDCGLEVVGCRPSAASAAAFWRWYRAETCSSTEAIGTRQRSASPGTQASPPRRRVGVGKCERAAGRVAAAA